MFTKKENSLLEQQQSGLRLQRHSVLLHLVPEFSFPGTHSCLAPARAIVPPVWPPLPQVPTRWFGKKATGWWPFCALRKGPARWVFGAHPQPQPRARGLPLGRESGKGRGLGPRPRQSAARGSPSQGSPGEDAPSRGRQALLIPREEETKRTPSPKHPNPAPPLGSSPLALWGDSCSEERAGGVGKPRGERGPGPGWEKPAAQPGPARGRRRALPPGPSLPVARRGRGKGLFKTTGGRRAQQTPVGVAAPLSLSWSSAGGARCGGDVLGDGARSPGPPPLSLSAAALRRPPPAARPAAACPRKARSPPQIKGGFRGAGLRSENKRPSAPPSQRRTKLLLRPVSRAGAATDTPRLARTEETAVLSLTNSTSSSD